MAEELKQPEVERFWPAEVLTDRWEMGSMTAAPDGDYVRWEDYEALRAQLPSQGGEAVAPACWQYKVYEERRFYPTDPREQEFWKRLGPDGIAHSAEPLYTRPADPGAVPVRRELLKEALRLLSIYAPGGGSAEDFCVEELRSLLANSEGVKP